MTKMAPHPAPPNPVQVHPKLVKVYIVGEELLVLLVLLELDEVDLLLQHRLERNAGEEV